MTNSWLQVWPEEEIIAEQKSNETIEERIKLIASVLRRGRDALSESASSTTTKFAAQKLKLRWRFGKLPRSCLTEYILNNRSRNSSEILFTPDVWHIEIESDGRTIVQLMLEPAIGDSLTQTEYPPLRSYIALGSAKFRFGLETYLQERGGSAEALSHLQALVNKFAEALSERSRLLRDIFIVISGSTRIRVGAPTARSEQVCLIQEIPQRKSSSYRTHIEIPEASLTILTEIMSSISGEPSWMADAIRLSAGYPSVILFLIIWLTLACDSTGLKCQRSSASLNLPERCDFSDSSWLIQLRVGLQNFWINETFQGDQDFAGFSLILAALIGGTCFLGNEDASFAAKLEKLNTDVCPRWKRSALAGLTYIFYNFKTEMLKAFSSKLPEFKTPSGVEDDLLDAAAQDQQEVTQSIKQWWAEQAIPPQICGKLKLVENEKLLLFLMAVCCGIEPVQIESVGLSSEAEIGLIEYQNSSNAPEQPIALSLPETEPRARVEIVERLSRPASGLSHVVARLQENYFHGDWDPSSISLQLASDISYPGKALTISPGESIGLTKETVLNDLPGIFGSIDASLSAENAICSNHAVMMECDHCRQFIGVINSLCRCGADILHGLLQLYASDRSFGIEPDFIIKMVQRFLTILINYTDESGRRLPQAQDELIKILDHSVRKMLTTEDTIMAKLPLAEAINRLAGESERTNLRSNGVLIFLRILSVQMSKYSNRNISKATTAEVVGKSLPFLAMLRLSIFQSIFILHGQHTTGLGAWQDLSEDLWRLLESAQFMFQDCADQAPNVIRCCVGSFLAASVKHGSVRIDISRKLHCKRLIEDFENSCAQIPHTRAREVNHR